MSFEGTLDHGMIPELGVCKVSQASQAPVPSSAHVIFVHMHGMPFPYPSFTPQTKPLLCCGIILAKAQLRVLLRCDLLLFAFLPPLPWARVLPPLQIPKDDAFLLLPQAEAQS